ncbi:MAG: L-aspartate oxidase [Psychrilyobacter sp.]|nr:L-aspartate oxidase [Psychrilyobacter sp.]
MNYDVIICGSGIAGIYTALNLDKKLKIAIITNSELKNCNTYLAQGGITTVMGESDKKAFIKDTLYAGGNENNLETVKLIAEESERNIAELVEMGVPFNRDKDGKLLYTREAAHSKRRILYSDDQTGKYIFLTLLKKLEERVNVDIFEEVEILDLLVTPTEVYGILAHDKEKKVFEICGTKVVLATGGIGGLFKNSTNRRNLKGIGIALAKKHGIKIADVGAIQFHPTAFYDPKSERRFLISESLRGEGAKLRDLDGNRFIDELLPRDVVAAGIEKNKKKSSSPFVYLDATHLDHDFMKNRFVGIYNNLLKNGIDITKDLIPVTTSQHYFMGGIQVDMDGKTDLKNLYACGEVAFTGFHGKNRLASNSLLEGLIFGKRVAESINKKIDKNKINKDCKRKGRLEQVDIEKIKSENDKSVIDEILKVREDLKDEFSIGR